MHIGGPGPASGWFQNGPIVFRTVLSRGFFWFGLISWSLCLHFVGWVLVFFNFLFQFRVFFCKQMSFWASYFCGVKDRLFFRRYEKKNFLTSFSRRQKYNLFFHCRCRHDHHPATATATFIRQKIWKILQIVYL